MAGRSSTPKRARGRIWIFFGAGLLVAAGIMGGPRIAGHRRSTARATASRAAVTAGRIPASTAAATAPPHAPAPDSANPPSLKLPPPVETFPHPATSVLEAQIELARRGFSCGPIDGKLGGQTSRALQAFQESEEISGTGRLDRETSFHLMLASPALKTVAVSAADLARLQPLSSTWLGKSQQTALDFETILELLAERSHAHPALLQQLNPRVSWEQLSAGDKVQIPDVERSLPKRARAAAVHIFLEERVLQVRDADDLLIAHCPVSIARDVEKRPVGELHVTVVIRNPNYTFDPDVFPESEEGRELGRRLVLPPGPNNPVGLVWIGLDRSGYGIHGTPRPEQVGRTESHGCFRLANWDALTLADLAWIGLTVSVDP